MSTMKHAYCILAHNEPGILEVLVRLIDDERNDIYIHLDKKSCADDFKAIKPKHSKLVWTKRISVNWGGYSQVESELLVLGSARNMGKGYKYYHLLSGVDLPIKSQDFIHAQLDSSYPQEYFEFSTDEANVKDLCNRTYWRYFFNEHYKDPIALRRKAYSYIRRLLLALQKSLGLRKSFDCNLAKGSNWFTVTEPCLDYILKNAQWLRKNFALAHAPDELSIPTLIVNSPFFNACARNNLRKIDWTRGGPYTWQSKDFDELINSDCMFARKFSSADKEIVRRIEKWHETKAS